LSEENDINYMRMALELAKRGLGHTSPNPLVGCVIVKNNRVIGTGFHSKAGCPHAEAEALAKAGKKAKGADLYVNLEPCGHFGKTPPCADAAVKYGIKRVIAAMQDPNPLVAGKGFKILRQNGIKTACGVLKEEAEKLNRIFIKNMTKQAPYVMMKAGMSIDGRIALKNGGSKWITGEGSLRHSQLLRKENDAILVGINTILADDPYLDCRADKTKKIKKVVMDTKGRTPDGANIFRHSEAPDIFIIAPEIKKARQKKFQARGVNVITGALNAEEAVKELWKHGIRSVLVEGGSSVITSFLRAGLIDEAYFYIAPVIIGGDGVPVFRNLGFTKLEKTYTIFNTEFIKIGKDMLVKGEVKYV